MISTKKNWERGFEAEIVLNIIKNNLSDLKVIFKWYKDYIN